MAKAIRTKPSKSSRATVMELADKGILFGERIGISHIIRAATGRVEEQGFDLYEFNSERERPLNFHPNAPKCSAWVSYGSGRARLTATYGNNRWLGTPYDLSSIFPENCLADQLLRQPDTRDKTGVPLGEKFYGDALLVTDIRQHWILSRRQAEEGEVEFFNESLSTPRTLCRGWNKYTPRIFFHEEPNEDDLIFMKLRFG
ncbi:hypothetical protein ACRBEV_25640 [Methylobacterium phyllosphaerae]